VPAEERLSHRGGRGIPLTGITADRARNGINRRVGEAAAILAQGRQRSVPRIVPCDELIQDHAKSVDVRTRRELTLALLWCSIAADPTHRTKEVRLPIPDQAHLNQLNMAGLIDVDGSWRQTANHQSGRTTVQIVEQITQLPGPPQKALLRDVLLAVPRYRP
jgi:hypothetical protein